MLIEVIRYVIKPVDDCLQFLIGHFLHFIEDSCEVGLEVLLEYLLGLQSIAKVLCRWLLLL